MSANPSLSLVPPRRRDQQREETRQRLFDAAIAEFRRVGFADAQIDDIVRAAGVARGTFYFHFPTKDHVLIELQRRAQERVTHRLAAIGRRRRPMAVRAFLQQVIEGMIAESASTAEPALQRELFSLVARRRPALEGEDYPLFDTVTRFFAEAQGRGEVRSDLLPSELTTIFLSGLFGALLTAGEGMSPSLRPALRRVVDVLVRGVAP